MFGEYLHRIQRAHSPCCEYCGAEVNSAQHTQEECPEWAPERAAVGEDLGLGPLLGAAVSSPASWKAIAVFCETVMARKEADECLRQQRMGVPIGPRARRRRRRREWNG